MQDLLAFLTRYELWVYGVLGTLAGLGLLVFWAAYQRADRALFGMERATAQGRQNLALGLSLGMLGLGLGIFVLLRYALPILNAPVLSPTVVQTVAAPTVVPTATAIHSGEPLVVDSSGCQDSTLILTAPVSGENIASAVYEIRGTANTPKFAFYKIEISNAGTSGAWVTLAVGREPIVNGRLGSFSTEPYQPGEYAFRLAVVDNLGQMSAPCVIVVTLGAAPPTSEP